MSEAATGSLMLLLLRYRITRRTLHPIPAHKRRSPPLARRASWFSSLISRRGSSSFTWLTRPDGLTNPPKPLSYGAYVEPAAASNHDLRTERSRRKARHLSVTGLIAIPSQLAVA